MKQVTASVISNIELMPGVYLIKANAPEIASVAKPGQFVMVSCGQDVILRRPLSVHQVVNSCQLLLLFNLVGKGTSWLAQRQKNEHISLLGPLGNGFTVDSNSKRLLLIAGGLGIAPLAFLAYETLAQEKEVTLLLGAVNASQLYPRKLLPSKNKIVMTTEDGSAGKKGMVTDILPDYIEQADQIFTCGPLPMYQSISNLMQQRSWHKPVQISLENRMGCGIGTCYSCSIKTNHGMKTVCHDGPVFNMNEIIWQEVKI